MTEAAKQFLIKLADLVEEYATEFYYTNNDDGIHISVGGEPDFFVGFSLDPTELRKAATSNALSSAAAVGGRLRRNVRA